MKINYYRHWVHQRKETLPYRHAVPMATPAATAAPPASKPAWSGIPRPHCIRKQVWWEGRGGASRLFSNFRVILINRNSSGPLYLGWSFKWIFKCVQVLNNWVNVIQLWNTSPSPIAGEDDGKNWARTPNGEWKLCSVLCHDNVNMAVKLCHKERICIHCRQTEVELQKHSLADGSTAQASAVRPRPTELEIFVCACRDGMYWLPWCTLVRSYCKSTICRGICDSPGLRRK